ncbi:TonB-dependent receptor [Kineobactrum sediminis]|uniref:TonB-dependent receptor n=1 Tax=Kineobactrum sediminis TaxID=1905677 RepID=A0A2N5Y3J9_9GAMM|nr:TonB-dependent receptor [Kineobactrum sediminis]PLW82970.1 TonB-dependent receptor [Kineobactrum sediminis]
MMNISRKKHLALSLTPLLCAPLAWSSELEEIRVTADFRQTAAALYPASLTVVDATTIKDRAAQHLEEVLNLAPNVNFAAGASRSRYLQIRGIGERSQFVDPINPSVGLTIDNINFSGIGNAATLFDVEQVEVLRGPQGTRFGAYGLAGMVNIVSAAPTEAFEGLLKAGIGNYDGRELGAVVSGGLAENLQGRLALQQYASDGFIRNDFLGRDDTGERDEKMARGRLRWQASDNLTVDSTVFYIDVDNGYDHFSLDNNRRTLSDEPGRDRQETVALGVTGTWTGNDHFSLAATVAIEHSDLEYGYDEDWTNTEICDGLACDSALWGFDWWYSSTDNYQRDREAQELDIRLVSSDDGKLFNTVDWTAGVYFYNKNEDLVRDYFNFDRGEESRFTNAYDTRHLALYGQLAAPLSDQLTLTIGGRVEDFSARYRDSRAVASSPNETLWGGEINLEYQLDASTVLYGLVSRGFKAGGVNGEALGRAEEKNFDDSVIAFLSERLAFETEVARNAEIGYKGAYLDGRWELRAALFYMERDDVQLRGWYNDGPLFVGYIDNGSSGRNQGMELETTVAVNDDLELFAGIGYLDTRIEDFLILEGSTLVNKSGRDQAHAPNYQYNVGARWSIAENLGVRVDVEGRDSFYFSDSHDRQSSAYTLLHASLDYRINNIDLKLWGRNLTDRDYAVRGFYFPNDPREFYEDDTAYIQLADPRTYGLSATYNF